MSEKTQRCVVCWIKFVLSKHDWYKRKTCSAACHIEYRTANYKKNLEKKGNLEDPEKRRKRLARYMIMYMSDPNNRKKKREQDRKLYQKRLAAKKVIRELSGQVSIRTNHQQSRSTTESIERRRENNQRFKCELVSAYRVIKELTNHQENPPC